LDFAAAIALVVFAWWISTGAVLYLVGMPRLTYPLTMGAITLALAMAFFGLWAIGDMQTPAAAYGGFLCGLVIWAWNELSFLTGLVTGPRTSECPVGAKGWARFSAAAQTVIYHELAIAASVLVAWLLTSGMPNQVGLYTLLILWIARLSAKLNVYLGVANLTEEFLPPHLRYLPSYFRKRSMNFLIPVSITVATATTAVLALMAFEPGADPFQVAAFTMLAALMALVVVEHWFLVLPMSPAAMWSWGLASRSEDDGSPAVATKFAEPAPIARRAPALRQKLGIKTS
jgi:putative photosynthetic complex assembly protein 2